jgi:putative SOS response-associated peptidase YedK
MCGRYTILPNAESWPKAFGLSEDAAYQISILSPNYNVAPTQDVPILRDNHETGELELALTRWGLIPSWAKDAKFSYHTINARAETVAEKPAFRDAFRKRRCLIPASGFYEWRKVGSKKQPYLIQMKDESPIAFAGLWETWNNPQDGTIVQSCTIIVTEANEFMKPIHDRMPVILKPDDYGRWLDPTTVDRKSLLKSCPSDWLASYPVSTCVNSPKNNDIKCIDPIAT